MVGDLLPYHGDKSVSRSPAESLRPARSSAPPQPAPWSRTSSSNSWMSVTYDADLEPTPVPSAGITRLRRYYGPLRHPKRPGLSLAGVRLRVTHPHRMGFPCCVRSPFTDMPPSLPRWPAGPGIARWTAYSNRFPVPRGCGLPHLCARSASTSVVSRPEERSLAITACRLAEFAKATRLSRRLRRFRFPHRRSDSYRLERPSCRVGVTPTEDQHLTRITAHTKLDTAKPPSSTPPRAWAIRSPARPPSGPRE